jgi:exopolyphosphatase/pppGpp-phosphohydrolase
VPRTLIDIGARLTRVVAVVDAVPDVTLELALGSQACTEQFFKLDPPALHELETAIDAIEDEVVRVRTMIPVGSALVATGAALHELGRAAGATSEALTIEAVEHLFQRLASASLGDPMARLGLPRGNSFAATALILREFMHHLGFATITFPQR